MEGEKGVRRDQERVREKGLANCRDIINEIEKLGIVKIVNSNLSKTRPTPLLTQRPVPLTTLTTITIIPRKTQTTKIQLSNTNLTHSGVNLGGH